VHATTFEFSYLPTSSIFLHTPITGTFDGTASGDFVTGISKISVYFNGRAFHGNGSLYAFHYERCCQFVIGGAVASFSGSHNNFRFSDDPTAESFNESNWFVSVAPGGGGGESTAAAFTRSLGEYAVENTNIANWRLRPVTPVPEPESFALFLVGLGLIGSVVRGRKQNI
jgi:hypothetical protein